MYIVGAPKGGGGLKFTDEFPKKGGSDNFQKGKGVAKKKGNFQGWVRHDDLTRRQNCFKKVKVTRASSP